ncbi:MAG: hypothetical protein Tsb0013_10970 [Phycisphaerales bacterium]
MRRSVRFCVEHSRRGPAFDVHSRRMSSGGLDHSSFSQRDGLAHAVGKRDGFAHTEVEVYLSLLRTTEELSVEFDELFKEHGLSQTQYNAMRILRGHGTPIPSGLVARQMVTREPDITRLLERLVKQGYVRRKRSEDDRRVMLAALTQSGLDVLNELDGPVLALHRRQLKHMPPEALRELIVLLERIRSVR